MKLPVQSNTVSIAVRQRLETLLAAYAARGGAVTQVPRGVTGEVFRGWHEASQMTWEDNQGGGDLS